MQPSYALHRQCVGVHRLYDIRSLRFRQVSTTVTMVFFRAYRRCNNGLEKSRDVLHRAQIKAVSRTDPSRLFNRTLTLEDLLLV